MCKQVHCSCLRLGDERLILKLGIELQPSPGAGRRAGPRSGYAAAGKHSNPATETDVKVAHWDQSAVI